MKIVYTKHLDKKLIDLRELGVIVAKHQIRSVLKSPLHLDNERDYPKMIATGKFDASHVLRVVYRIEGDIIIVITCYPTRIGRYQI